MCMISFKIFMKWVSLNLTLKMTFLDVSGQRNENNLNEKTEMKTYTVVCIHVSLNSFIVTHLKVIPMLYNIW